MPALYTHYTCGLLNYRSMKEGYLKDCIRQAQHAYSIGLAGPDIFFYNFLDSIFMDRTAGSILHVERTGAFLQALFEQIETFKGKDRTIATAYVAGFVGHYELDCACHPIVYAQMDEETGAKSMGQHFRFEAAIDVYCCKYYLNRSMKQMNASVLTALSKREEKVIAKIVTDAYHKVFPEYRVSAFNMHVVLFFYKIVTMLIMDKNGWKERLFLPVEKLIFKAPFATPLFINSNRYHIAEDEWEEFRICFEKGRRDLAEVTPYFEKALTDSSAKEDFYHVLGNKSYHTGETIE